MDFLSLYRKKEDGSPTSSYTNREAYIIVLPVVVDHRLLLRSHDISPASS